MLEMAAEALEGYKDVYLHTASLDGRDTGTHLAAQPGLPLADTISWMSWASAVAQRLPAVNARWIAITQLGSLEEGLRHIVWWGQ